MTQQIRQHIMPQKEHNTVRHQTDTVKRMSYNDITDAFPYNSACQQHYNLRCTACVYFLLFTRPRTLHCSSFFLVAFLLLSGNVELNTDTNSCTVVQSRHLLYSAPTALCAISQFIDSHTADIFCLTETLIKPNTPLLNLHNILQLTTASSVSYNFLF